MKPLLRLAEALRTWLLEERERAREARAVRGVDRSLFRLRRLRGKRPDAGEEEALVGRLVEAGATSDPPPSETEVTWRLTPEEVRRRQSIFQNRIRTMDERLADDPEDLDALFAKATFLALRQEYDEAAHLLNDLTRLDPAYPGAWHLKAEVYRLMGDARMAGLCLASAERVS